VASPNRVSPLISGRAKGVLDIRTRRWEFRCRSYGATPKFDTDLYKYFAPRELSVSYRWRSLIIGTVRD